MTVFFFKVMMVVVMMMMVMVMGSIDVQGCCIGKSQ